MKTKLFAIYDDKVEAFARPFFEQTTASAIRAFTEVANNPETAFYKHGADYTLFEIGEFDDNTGEITPLSHMANLGNALTFRVWPAPELVEEEAREA